MKIAVVYIYDALLFTNLIKSIVVLLVFFLFSVNGIRPFLTDLFVIMDSVYNAKIRPSLM